MTTTSTRDPMVGLVLDGRYEILQRAARGGMATVYRALDTRLQRIVAIKVMHENLGEDGDFAAKFDREARAAAGITHPNVVAVFDQGHGLDPEQEQHRPYIVMEFVPGTTLRSVISRDAPLSPLRALDLLDPVLSALAEAHRLQLVHRDVKPENVLISDRGQVKVADFGLAKAVSSQTSTATAGVLIGTVSYVPPELVMHGAADARADVYSFGIVLFETLTGRKPHTGETPYEVVYAHVNKDVPAPSSVTSSSWRLSRDAIPPYLDALVRTACARDPADRPPDARVLQAMLRESRDALVAGVMDDPELSSRMGDPRLFHDAPAPSPSPAVTPPPPGAGGLSAPMTAPTPDGPPTRTDAAAPARRHPAPTRVPRTPVPTPGSRTPARPADGLPARAPTRPRLRTTFTEDEVTGGDLRPSPSSVPLEQLRTPLREQFEARVRARRRRGQVLMLLVLLLTVAVAVGTWWTASGR